MKAWLLRAALNRCVDIHRFRLRRTALSLDEVPELARPADDEAAELWEAVSRLPEGERTAVHLHYAEGYRTEDLLGGTNDEQEQVSECSGEHLRAHGA